MEAEKRERHPYQRRKHTDFLLPLLHEFPRGFVVTTGDEIILKDGDYALSLRPAIGGAVSRFRWRGIDLFRPMVGDSILDAACFPMVPFCNRIAGGSFSWSRTKVHIAPNFPAVDAQNPLHGWGWISPWYVEELSTTAITLGHDYSGMDWPWPYHAVQHFTLEPHGLHVVISVKNLGHSPMPAGVGLHPYLPLNAQTTFVGRHRYEALTAPDGLPHAVVKATPPMGRHDGLLVRTRAMDTHYLDRDGAMAAQWLDFRTRLTIAPSENLPCTAVFAPEGGDFFCVEPMSHSTNAINGFGTPMATLAPSETLTATVVFSATEI